MCGVRAAVQPSLKAFILIYMSHVIQGSTFGEEKWILPASDLLTSYVLHTIVCLLATDLQRTE
jgi:hypothetical protein